MMQEAVHQSSKNQRLLQELLMLKSEINNLKSLQNEHMLQNISHSMIQGHSAKTETNKQSSFRNQLNDFEQENEQLRQQLAKKEQIIDYQSNELQEQGDRIMNLERDLREKTKSIARLEEMVQNLLQVQ